MGDVVRVGGEFGTVHGEADLGRLAEGADDVRIFLAVLDAHDLDLTGLILENLLILTWSSFWWFL